MDDTTFVKVRQAKKEMFAEMNATSMAGALPTVYEKWLEMEDIAGQDIVRVTFSFPVGHQPTPIPTDNKPN